MKQNLSDPVIDEIREVRHRISARFDHDPTRLVAFYMKRQKQYQDRLLRPKRVPSGAISQPPDTALQRTRTSRADELGRQVV